MKQQMNMKHLTLKFKSRIIKRKEKTKKVRKSNGGNSELKRKESPIKIKSGILTSLSLAHQGHSSTKTCLCPHRQQLQAKRDIEDDDTAQPEQNKNSPV